MVIKKSKSMALHVRVPAATYKQIDSNAKERQEERSQTVRRLVSLGLEKNHLTEQVASLDNKLAHILRLLEDRDPDRPESKIHGLLESQERIIKALFTLREGFVDFKNFLNALVGGKS